MTRTVSDAWADFDKATSGLNQDLVNKLKKSSTRWTVPQLDTLVELLAPKNFSNTDSQSANIPKTSHSSPKKQVLINSDTSTLPKFGTIHNSLLWAGFLPSEIVRIDQESPILSVLQGNLDHNVPFRIDLDAEGTLIKTVAPGSPTQYVVKKKLESDVRSLLNFVVPHDRLFLSESDPRFIELLRVLNIPTRII